MTSAITPSVSLDRPISVRCTGSCRSTWTTAMRRTAQARRTSSRGVMRGWSRSRNPRLPTAGDRSRDISNHERGAHPRSMTAEDPLEFSPPPGWPIAPMLSLPPAGDSRPPAPTALPHGSLALIRLRGWKVRRTISIIRHRGAALTPSARELPRRPLSSRMKATSCRISQEAVASRTASDLCPALAGDGRPGHESQVSVEMLESNACRRSDLVMTHAGARVGTNCA